MIIQGFVLFVLAYWRTAFSLFFSESLMSADVDLGCFARIIKSRGDPVFALRYVLFPFLRPPLFIIVRCPCFNFVCLSTLIGYGICSIFLLLRSGSFVGRGGGGGVLLLLRSGSLEMGGGVLLV